MQLVVNILFDHENNSKIANCPIKFATRYRTRDLCGTVPDPGLASNSFMTKRVCEITIRIMYAAIPKIVILNLPLNLSRHP